MYQDEILILTHPTKSSYGTVYKFSCNRNYLENYQALSALSDWHIWGVL